MIWRQNQSDSLDPVVVPLPRKHPNDWQALGFLRGKWFIGKPPTAQSTWHPSSSVFCHGNSQVALRMLKELRS